MQLYAISKGGDFSDGRSLAVKNEVVTERGGEGGIQADSSINTTRAIKGLHIPAEYNT